MPDSDAVGAVPGAAYPNPTNHRPESTRFVPGEGWYAIPPLLLVAGLWLGMLVTHATMDVAPGQRLKVPGETKFTVTSPGRYVLWDEYRTDWDGVRINVKPILRAFDASQLEIGSIPAEVAPKINPEAAKALEMPDSLIVDRAFVTINQLPENTPVKQVAVLHSRENIEKTVRVTLGAYQLPAAGEYTLRVWGDFPERVFQLRKAPGLRYYIGFLSGLGISLIGGLGAPALFLWIYLRRKQALEGMA